MDRSRAQDGLDKLARAVVSRQEADTPRRVERAITDAGLVRSSQLNAPIPTNLTGVVDAVSVTTAVNTVSAGTTLDRQIADIVASIQALVTAGGGGGTSTAAEYLYVADGTDPDWLTDADGHVLRWSA